MFMGSSIHRANILSTTAHRFAPTLEANSGGALYAGCVFTAQIVIHLCFEGRRSPTISKRIGEAGAAAIDHRSRG